MFCGGIEDTFIADPYPATGKTLDEYELTGHYDNFLKDFELVSSLGIKGLRWGIPWYKVEREKGKGKRSAPQGQRPYSPQRRATPYGKGEK